MNPHNDAYAMVAAMLLGTLYYYWYIFVAAGLLSWAIIHYMLKESK
jgi:hypothetical protein